MEPQMQPVVVKTFTGATQAIVAEQYAADAVVAARLGYAPTSETWDSTQLTVMYQLQTPVEVAVSPPAEEYPAEANARANQERAADNAWANQERADASSSSRPPVPPSVAPPPGEPTG
jgi:hypothetical protein